MSEVLLHAPHVPRMESRTFYKERDKREGGRQTDVQTEREKERERE